MWWIFIIFTFHYSLVPLRSPHTHSLFYKQSTKSSFCCPPTQECGAIHGTMVSIYTSSHTLKKNWLSLSKDPSTANGATVRSQGSWSPVHPCWNVALLDLGQVLCRQPQPLWVYESSILSGPKDTLPPQSSLTSGTNSLFYPSSSVISEPCGGGGAVIERSHLWPRTWQILILCPLTSSEFLRYFNSLLSKLT